EPAGWSSFRSTFWAAATAQQPTTPKAKPKAMPEAGRWRRSRAIEPKVMDNYLSHHTLTQHEEDRPAPLTCVNASDRSQRSISGPTVGGSHKYPVGRDQ